MSLVRLVGYLKRNLLQCTVVRQCQTDKGNIPIYKHQRENAQNKSGNMVKQSMQRKTTSSILNLLGNGHQKSA
jgi:hypothetical protein